MAEDTKRNKLSLPARPAGDSNSHRAPLRGGNNPRAVREGRIGREGRNDHNSEERRPRFNDRREGGDSRGFGERRPRPDLDGRREAYGDRPQRPREDRPARDDSRPRFNDRREGGERGFGERRPRPDFEGRRESFGDRPRRDDDRPRFNDRGEGGNRGFGDRRPRPDFEGRRESFGDRPQRFREDRPARDDNRPRFNDRREGGDRGFGDRRPRPEFDGRRESYGDRPQRFREDRPARDDSRPRFNDHREGGERGFGERRPRPDFEGRRESFGDRPQRAREDRPARDDSRPRFNERREGGNDRSFGERRPRGDFGDRRDSFRDRPQRTEEDRPYRANPHVRVYRAEESQDAYSRYKERQARGFGERERPAFRSREDEQPRFDGPQERAEDFDPANAPRQGRSFARSRGSAPQEEGYLSEPAEHQARHTEPDAPGSMRLSKRMSELGLCSRREADNYIERGWVKVDGEIISELGHKVLPDQHIELTMVAEEMQMNRVTILINKPIGYVSGQAEDGYEPAYVLVTAENHWDGDPVKRPFEARMVRKLAPAGRLDIDSTGLLVLTQDGRVAKHIIGERSNVEKEYLVRVEGDLLEGGLDMLRHGLELDGVQLEPAKISWQNEDQLRIVLHEGRKRQIRRMCELVGLRVVGLKRVRIGQIPLGKLPLGQWRYLGEHEEF